MISSQLRPDHKPGSATSDSSLTGGLFVEKGGYRQPDLPDFRVADTYTPVIPDRLLIAGVASMGFADRLFRFGVIALGIFSSVLIAAAML